MLVRAIERPKHRSLTVAAPFEAYSRSESVMLSQEGILVFPERRGGQGS
jgi:hypothetical protein